MECYIKCASKAEANRQLATGKTLEGISYSPFGVESVTFPNNSEESIYVKFYVKIVMGSPYAKSYGVWDKVKKRFK